MHAILIVGGLFVLWFIVRIFNVEPEVVMTAYEPIEVDAVEVNEFILQERSQMIEVLRRKHFHLY
jgi:hypothetical protein